MYLLLIHTNWCSYVCRNTSLATLVSSLAPHIFVPGQSICTEGQLLHRVYFVHRGKVELLHQRSEYIAAVAGERVFRIEQDNIGIDDFLDSDAMQRRVSRTARALTYCDVMSLLVRELDEALQQDALERIHAERHQRQKASGQKDGESKAMCGVTANPQRASLMRSDASQQLRRVGKFVMAASRAAQAHKASTRRRGDSDESGRALGRAIRMSAPSASEPLDPPSPCASTSSPDSSSKGTHSAGRSTPTWPSHQDDGAAHTTTYSDVEAVGPSAK
jgi:CRP-like cAMP-binding protein